MGFTARIVFTGVCGIVPKKEDATDPVAICAVLPNAWDPDPEPDRVRVSIVDDVSVLRRHTSFVQFATHPPNVDPLDDDRRDLEGLWFLRNHKLFVEPDFESGGPGPHAKWGDIDGLASYEDIVSAGNHRLLSVEDAVRAPDPAKIIGQVFVSTGVVSCPEGDPTWVFEGYLRPNEDLVTKKLNHQVTVTIEGLSSLRIVQKDFGGNFVKSFTFSDGNGDALVIIANLCDRNPLQWGDPATLRDDYDFCWYYEIVDSPDDLKIELEPFRCPIPRLTGDMGGGNGLNCVDFKFPAVDF
jgi:hypothetical protein